MSRLDPTVWEVYEEFLHHQPTTDRRPATISCYARRLAVLVKYLGPQTPVSQVTSAQPRDSPGAPSDGTVGTWTLGGAGLARSGFLRLTVVANAAAIGPLASCSRQLFFVLLHKRLSYLILPVNDSQGPPEQLRQRAISSMSESPHSRCRVTGALKLLGHCILLIGSSPISQEAVEEGIL
jgi:hypothetical protein